MDAFFERFCHELKLSLTLRVDRWPKPAKLAKRVSTLEQKHDPAPTRPEPRDLEQLRQFILRLWTGQGWQGLKQFPARHLDKVPWILYWGDADSIVARNGLLEAILQLLAPRWKTCLKPLIHVYLLYYNPDLPGNDRLRSFILEHLSGQKLSQPSLRRWKERAALLFAPNAPLNAGRWLIQGTPEKVPEALVDLGLSGELAVGNFLRQAVREALAEMVRYLPAKLESLSPLLELPDRPSQCRFPELVAEAADSIIPAADAIATLEQQEYLRRFFLRHLSDPRLGAGATRWSEVSAEAKAIFIRWLSRQDLELFFGVVDRSAYDRQWMYRRAFWETYLPYMEETWVALGPLGERVLRRLNLPREYHYGRLVGGSHEQSVFMIRMRGYVFVEWSNNGPLRIWKQEAFPLRFGQPEYSATEIRWSNEHERIVHASPGTYSWQRRAREWIQVNLGITPKGSYELT
ncbi:MAG: hypothetical protein H5U02_07335 [Clostridia bacterium]|nr:hypothetical protein [Clostridia bacterium]